MIPTTTSTSAVKGKITVNTGYDEGGVPETIQATLASVAGNQDTVKYVEGELLMEMENSPEDLFYAVDDYGNLILIIGTGDESAYSMDNEGNLIYTTYE